MHCYAQHVVAEYNFAIFALHVLEIAVGIIKTKYPSFKIAPSPQRIYPNLDYFNDMQIVIACFAQQPLKFTEIVVPVLYEYLSSDAAINSKCFKIMLIPNKVLGSAKTLRRRSLPLIKLQPQAVKPESSGWMVLHAMQRILAAPTRETALTRFKCKVLAATQVRTLKPTEKDFANLIYDVDRIELFNNAMYAMDNIFVTNHNYNSPNVIEPVSGHMWHKMFQKIAMALWLYKMFRKFFKIFLCPAPAKTLQKFDLVAAGRADRLKYWTTKNQLNDTGVKRELVKTGNGKFCIRNNNSIRRIRKKQEEGKAWSNLCDLKSYWGLERYILLSAVPEDIQKAPIREITEGI
ncbi:uncharacterized protein PgNI_12171 [Pyricularia grisea]|uniref:Uncharacterized protein n=1 Tax=Pyricularia grisea TaxID=148305 RepID=A0A6P8AQB3_PYRGI|nr:uncharacterized protein PgNI_12171 [Pyricularia grisea]TLD04241.1 hypothetical protein PgNI_12171 [Pyricularia grisea]